MIPSPETKSKQHEYRSQLSFLESYHGVIHPYTAILTTTDLFEGKRGYFLYINGIQSGYINMSDNDANTILPTMFNQEANFHLAWQMKENKHVLIYNGDSKRFTDKGLDYQIQLLRNSDFFLTTTTKVCRVFEIQDVIHWSKENNICLR